MQTFPNVALADTYTGTGTSDFYSDKGVAVFVSIFNNAAAFEIIAHDPNHTTELINLAEQATAPGSFLVEGAAGIRLRNNVAGSVARAFITIFEPTDPRIAGFNPTTVIVNASGGTVPSTAVANVIIVSRAAQSIPSGALTTVSYDTIDGQAGTTSQFSLSGGAVVVGTDGYYEIALTHTFGVNPVEALADIEAPSGTNRARNESSGVNASINSVSQIVKLSSGQSIIGRVYQQSGGPVNVQSRMEVAQLA